MGMGYAANCVDTIEETAIQEVCPEEFKDFLNQLEKYDIPIHDFSWKINCEDYSDLHQDIKDSYEKLCTKFNNNTGLTIGLGFHDMDDDGDRYDDIDGHYWWVDQVYKYTDPGLKYSKFINKKFFVTFG